MNQWIILLGTLLGTMLGGTISYLTMRYQSRNQRRIASRKLAEDRAIWAAERELDSLRQFYATVERLSAAAMEYRIRKAHELFNPEDIPDWVKDAGDAREGIETALSESYDEAYLLRSDVREKFELSIKQWNEYFLESDSRKALDHLMRLQSSLFEFKKSLAAEIRTVFDARRSGTDLN